MAYKFSMDKCLVTPSVLITTHEPNTQDPRDKTCNFPRRRHLDPPGCWFPKWKAPQGVTTTLTPLTPGSKYMAQTYFFRGGCAIYLTVIFFKDMYPKQQKCPEDGATLHVQNGPNCAIYPIFNLNPLFRGRTFRSSKR